MLSSLCDPPPPVDNKHSQTDNLAIASVTTQTYNDEDVLCDEQLFDRCICIVIY